MKANNFKELKKNSHKWSMITAYDYPFSKLAAQAEIEFILVGDSGANVVLGLDSTCDIGMAEMLMFCGAVKRGISGTKTQVVVDMPWGADHGVENAVKNAKLFIQEGADFVKLEGPRFDEIKAIVSEDIAVVGHLGLTPQTATSWKQAAKKEDEQNQLIADALEIEKAGASLLVLEHIPSEIARRVTQALTIPTIGIGAGRYTDGQVLVLHDMLGISEKIPPIAKAFNNLRTPIFENFKEYNQWVKSGCLDHPTELH
ncbi:3-methyl-2-oxobutanoate hydroxymethyltransferase [Fibrobacterales bacterium]|nr:3-methyl-2-oxobutanoate hydroxymethyltransferase [Fibrobacterales bacterium]